MDYLVKVFLGKNQGPVAIGNYPFAPFPPLPRSNTVKPIIAGNT